MSGSGFASVQGSELLLGVSWAFIRGVISRIILVRTRGGLLAPLIATHEPPSTSRIPRVPKP